MRGCGVYSELNRGLYSSLYHFDASCDHAGRSYGCTVHDVEHGASLNELVIGLASGLNKPDSTIKGTKAAPLLRTSYSPAVGSSLTGYANQPRQASDSMSNFSLLSDTAPEAYSALYQNPMNKRLTHWAVRD